MSLILSVPKTPPRLQISRLGFLHSSNLWTSHSTRLQAAIMALPRTTGLVRRSLRVWSSTEGSCLPASRRQSLLLTPQTPMISRSAGASSIRTFSSSSPLLKKRKIAAASNSPARSSSDNAPSSSSSSSSS
ncbi:hypothetical protein TPAR_07082, partial [Tolypocladium paradoxum]